MSSTNDNKNKKNGSELPLVPESILRKRHNLDDLVRKRKALTEVGSYKPKQGGAKSDNTKKIYVKKPETFIAKAKSRYNETKRYKRVKTKGMHKRASNQPVIHSKEIVVEDTDSHEPKTVTVQYQANSIGSKMVFVIRMRDDQGISPQVKSMLHRLRLKCIHDGVFVRYDTDSARRMLHTIEPYIVYGKPSIQTITDLIERRGHACIPNNNSNSTGDSSKNMERIPLSDNTIIEAHLGTKYNILCKEDLVHEIDTVGESFDIIANQFLYPFKLVDTKTHFERTTLKIKNNKDYGDRGDEINEYIQQVL